MRGGKGQGCEVYPRNGRTAAFAFLRASRAGLPARRLAAARFGRPPSLCQSSPSPLLFTPYTPKIHYSHLGIHFPTSDSPCVQHCASATALQITRVAPLPETPRSLFPRLRAGVKTFSCGRQRRGHIDIPSHLAFFGEETARQVKLRLFGRAIQDDLVAALRLTNLLQLSDNTERGQGDNRPSDKRRQDAQRRAGNVRFAKVLAASR